MIKKLIQIKNNTYPTKIHKGHNKVKSKIKNKDIPSTPNK